MTKSALAATLLLGLAAPVAGHAEVSEQTLGTLSVPDRLETRIGTLDFKAGVPSPETARKAYDAVDFSRALSAYDNSFRGASAYALRAGFHGLGAEDNDIAHLLEADGTSNSLFLTANADTVYYLGAIDLSNGPMVVEQPADAVGTINDMWFDWVVDIGFPGPDRGRGGKYLLVPPGYDGPLPEGGYFVAHAKTDHLLYAARAYLAGR